MARVIAAEDEWRSRQVLLPFNRQPAITKEKSPAEGLKHSATSGWRQEHAFRFARASHRTYGVVSLPFPIRRGVSLPEPALRRGLSPRQSRRERQHKRSDDDAVDRKRHEPVLPHVAHEPRHGCVGNDVRNHEADRQHNPSMGIDLRNANRILTLAHNRLEQRVSRSRNHRRDGHEE